MNRSKRYEMVACPPEDNETPPDADPYVREQAFGGAKEQDPHVFVRSDA